MKRKNKKLQLWERDYRVLEDLEANPQSTSQITVLHGFPNQKKAAQRLKQYYDTGLVFRIPKPGFKQQGKTEYVYFSKNFTGCYTGHVKHALLVNDFRIALKQALRSLVRDKFYYSSQVDARHLWQHNIVPDGILVLIYQSLRKKLLHFLEIDRGTERKKSKKHYGFELKIEKYASYFDSGKYRQDFSADIQGFRVLVVCQSEKRAENLLKLSVEMSAEFFWFTTLEILKNPLALLWSYGNKTAQPLIRVGI